MLSYAAAVDEGLVSAVGVCNYDVSQLKQFHSLMAARNIPVVSNQASVNHLGHLGLCYENLYLFCNQT